MDQSEQDPRAQYRELPARVKPEDAVETSPAEDPRVVEIPEEVYLRVVRGPHAG